MTDARAKVVHESLQAWQRGACNDRQLEVGIAALKDALTTLEALDAGWMITLGIRLQLQSMESAMDSRKRSPRPPPDWGRTFDIVSN